VLDQHKKGPPDGGPLPCPGQYSLGSKMVLLAKYSAISGSGKSVYSIAFVKTMWSLPSSHVSVAVWSGLTVSFHT
jgi:hypothetical protein